MKQKNLKQNLLVKFNQIKYSENNIILDRSIKEYNNDILKMNFH